MLLCPPLVAAVQAVLALLGPSIVAANLAKFVPQPAFRDHWSLDAYQQVENRTLDHHMQHLSALGNTLLLMNGTGGIEPVYFINGSSAPLGNISAEVAKREEHILCGPAPRNTSAPVQKKRIAVLFRGEAFRDGFKRGSRSTCCKAGLEVQRLVFLSHKKMFEQMVVDGYESVDVFGTTYACDGNISIGPLENLLHDWYRPWIHKRGYFRLLSRDKVDAVSHLRAPVFDLWRSIYENRPRSLLHALIARDIGSINSPSQGIDRMNPYSHVLEMRWDQLVHNYSSCIFEDENPLDATDLRGTDADLMHVVPRRYMGCMRAKVQHDQAFFGNYNTLRAPLSYSRQFCHEMRKTMDGKAIISYPQTEYDLADPDFHQPVMYLEPSCRRRAGKMFLMRPSFVPTFLGGMAKAGRNVTSNCSHGPT